MGIVEVIVAASKRACLRIVLAEGEDERVVQAAAWAAREGMARMSVVGRPEAFSELAEGLPGGDLVTVHDPATSDHTQLIALTGAQAAASFSSRASQK